jgi:hypothetical protein
LDIYIKVFAMGRPVFSRTSFVAPQPAPREARRLLLPLSHDGFSVHQVPTVHLFKYRHLQPEPASPKVLDVADNVIEVL